MQSEEYHGSLDIAALSHAYASDALTVTAVVESVLARIAARGDDHVWISRVEAEELRARARALTRLSREARRQHPLYGIPFAVKDNIDVAGMPTTAACPDYAYRAPRTATVVQKLLDAGAVLIGKTNLDQFATGLVGTRSPYGIPVNPFNADYIPGGSSSGSAVAVAAGLVSFALGTDTAGSGRVPAAYNNIVGLKPTRGVLSTHGVVPACRSLDCVSIFAYTCADALVVMVAAAGYDPADAYSRHEAARQRPALRAHPQHFRFGVPAPAQLEFFGEAEAAAAYDLAVRRLQALGGEAVTIDYAPFDEAAALLYTGPWVAERQLVMRELLQRSPESVHAHVRASIARAAQFDAGDVFAAQHRLAALRREVEALFTTLDCLVLPTVGRMYRIAEVLSDPLAINSRLGRYTNFLNLLDLCAVAVPVAMLPAGVPWGVTLAGMPYSEEKLAVLGERLHRASPLSLGATGQALPSSSAQDAQPPPGYLRLCVCGAHMSGLALNPQLLARGGRLWSRTRTATSYRLYAMEEMRPPRPGMLRDETGVAVEVEVWELPSARFGEFIADVPSPLAIGMVELQDGTQVHGFLCEAYALRRARDISHLGGWRAYLASRGG